MPSMWELLKRPEGFLPLLISAAFLSALLLALEVLTVQCGAAIAVLAIVYLKHL